MHDLQARLRAAGVELDAAVPGVLCARTQQAVRTFQATRGLHVDGQCGPQTWAALVEASYRLGDRVLYQRTPMLRGDDVADLQRHLGRLGFDAGRVDGIYGPLTAAALADFQRNVGLQGDGIYGPETGRALERLGTRSHSASAVVTVREQEELAAPRTLAGGAVVLGHTGQLDALVHAVASALYRAGSTVAVTKEPDGSRQAAFANAVDAGVYVGFSLATPARPPEAGPSVAYYAVPGFCSTGGHRLAELLAERLGTALGEPFTTAGMRVPVLRETRMPAVLCEVPATRSVLEGGPDLATVVATTLGGWMAAPAGEQSGKQRVR